MFLNPVMSLIVGEAFSKVLLMQRNLLLFQEIIGFVRVTRSLIIKQYQKGRVWTVKITKKVKNPIKFNSAMIFHRFKVEIKIYRRPYCIAYQE
jgi:hypothetical protein